MAKWSHVQRRVQNGNGLPGCFGSLALPRFAVSRVVVESGSRGPLGVLGVRWPEETGRRRKSSLPRPPRLRPPSALRKWLVRSLLGAPLTVHAAALSGWKVAPPRCHWRSRWSR